MSDPRAPNCPVILTDDHGHRWQTRTRSAPWRLGDGTEVQLPVAMFTWKPAPSRARPGTPAPMRRWIFEARTSTVTATYTIINVPAGLDEMESMVFQINRMLAYAASKAAS